jgi:hypothetical protein
VHSGDGHVSGFCSLVTKSILTFRAASIKFHLSVLLSAQERWRIAARSGSLRVNEEALEWVAKVAEGASGFNIPLYAVPLV